MTKNTSDLDLALTEWTTKITNKIFETENEWLKANLQREGIPLDGSAKDRCKVTKGNTRHNYLWDTTLYIDNKIVSILSINTVTMEAEVSNADGFVSKGIIR
jgi:hypothetical protein